MQVLILRRGETRYWRNTWECPGGKVEHGEENVSATLVREVQEETGLIIKPEICILAGKYDGQPYNELEKVVPHPDPVDYEVTYYLVSCEGGIPSWSGQHIAAIWELPINIVTNMRDTVRPCTRNAVINGIFTTVPSMIREGKLPIR